MNESPLPTQHPATRPDVEALKKSNKRKLTWGITCLVGPTVLIILTIMLYAAANFLFFSAAPETSADSDLFAQPSPAQAIVNVVLFLVGAFSTLTWLPGIIVGIVLLASRKPVPQQ